MTEEPGTDDAVVERFAPTNGRFSGLVGLGFAAVVLVFSVAARDPDRPLGVALLAVLAGLLSWAVLLRPALWTTASDLVMRGVLRTVRIPFVLIDEVTVTQVLTVSARGKRYVSPIIGYSARQLVKGMGKGESRRSGRLPVDEPKPAVHSEQTIVVDRLNQLARDSRAGLGGTTGSLGQVTRSYAWPEIAGLAIAVVAFVTWLLT